MAGNRGPGALIHRIEDSVAVAALVLVTILPPLEILLRQLRTGIPASTDYVQHLVLWIACLGGMITSREGRHLTISVGTLLLKGRGRDTVLSITGAIACLVSFCLARGSWEFLNIGFDPGLRVGLFSVRLVFVIMPIAFAVMAIRFFLHAPAGIFFRTLSVIVVVSGAFVCRQPQLVAQLTIPLIVLLLVCLWFDMPIFTVLGGIALLLFNASGGMIAVMANEAYTMLRGPIMPTIPLFTLAGFILSESKAGERLVEIFRALFGWLPGGLAIVSILILTFFTSLTGASSVTILALGGLLLFILKENGYPENFATGLLTVNGVGTLFAPSLPVIMYAVVAQVSIKQIFVAGVLPGISMIIALAAMALFTASRHKVQRAPFRMAAVAPALKKAWGELLIPLVILIPFLTGLTTLVETSAITVLYVIIVQIFVHRDMQLQRLPAVFIKAITIMGGVLTILAIAKGLSYYIVDEQIPLHLVDWLQARVQSKIVFLLLLNLALIITGCFMDIFSAIIVVVPLIAPLGSVYGIDPVHMGIIFLANLELGFLTPPIGMNLFLASYRFNKSLTLVSRCVLPFIVVILLSVLLITYVPWLTMVLIETFNVK